METIEITNKCECGVETNPFSESLVSDAWVKNGIAHFEYKCECGKTQEITMPWGRRGEV